VKLLRREHGELSAVDQQRRPSGGFTETNLADEDFVSPFVYENGTMTLISPLFGWATGINDVGQVTGFLQFSSIGPAGTPSLITKVC
jgi:hypothetical protein